MARDTGLFKLEGLSDCLDALDELPKATSKNVLKRSLIDAAQQMLEDARQLAEPHILSGTLYGSINIGTKLSRSQAGSAKESPVEVYLGPRALVQAITLEFGTFQQPPSPFMRPAWQANKHQTLQKVASSLAQEILKAAQRLARKAAREAAKTGK